MAESSSSRQRWQQLAEAEAEAEKNGSQMGGVDVVVAANDLATPGCSCQAATCFSAPPGRRWPNVQCF